MALKENMEEPAEKRETAFTPAKARPLLHLCFFFLVEEARCSCDAAGLGGLGGGASSTLSSCAKERKP